MQVFPVLATRRLRGRRGEGCCDVLDKYIDGVVFQSVQFFNV